MEAQGANQGQPAAARQPTDASANPFTASTGQMFNDFEKVKTEMPKGADGQGIPGMNDADLDNFEKQFSGMFQNIVQQMENLDDDDDDDDE